MSFDISDTLAPDSDQLDAVELINNPRTFTVDKVTRGSAEQPVQVYFRDFPRPWRPGKTMRRLLAACWGNDASQWIGRRVRLYCDETVRFGNDVVGGTRIAALSHIQKPRTIPLQSSRGKVATYKIEPLTEEAPTSPQVSDELLAELSETLHRKGIPEDKWLPGVNHITGGSASALDTITEAEARQVLAALADRPDVESQDQQGEQS